MSSEEITMAQSYLSNHRANGRHPDPFMGLSREMGKMLDTFFSGAHSIMNMSAPGAMVSPLKLDVFEDDQEVCVMAEMPGVRADDVEVRLEGSTLLLGGHKRDQADLQREHVHLMERSYGQFFRMVPLPFAPDAGQVEAVFENGVLTVHIPKQERQETSQRIHVRETRSEPSVPQPAHQPSWNGQPGAQASTPASPQETQSERK
ncbi:Hsp20 family protein [Aquabacterium fontiphilum]|uniref:Hsp20/alpha crystallin family protein n=1 Tax=Aquabacterium fontiphilum TaxID=450365 RepID=UPI001376DC59|nr:Hsp20/alpha crystallin family protein [Aquabacterium fontiphilum]NBD22110.1 Hsp20 family protein [Aquabacterium fontiphilum]